MRNRRCKHPSEVEISGLANHPELGEELDVIITAYIDGWFSPGDYNNPPESPDVSFDEMVTIDDGTKNATKISFKCVTTPENELVERALLAAEEDCDEGPEYEPDNEREPVYYDSRGDHDDFYEPADYESSDREDF